MKKLLLALIAALAFLPAIAGNFPDGSPSFSTDYDKALATAKETGKPLVLVFSAAWCPPCQQMKNEVYPSKDVKTYHDDFVWAYLDTDEASNSAAGQKYGVSGIPHIQFLKSDGTAIDKQIGSSSPKDFSKTLKKVLAEAK